ADGSLEPYDRSKVVSTCLKLGADYALASEVADRVEERLYEGIPTERILRMVKTYLGQLRPRLLERTDLKEALSLLRSKPDWERFVQLLYVELGYKVDPNPVLRGLCVTCELDAIAKRGSDRILVEAKHHLDPHARVDLGVCREVRAVIEDLSDGYLRGYNSEQFTGAVVVSNARFTEQALQYARCRGIECLGWNVPKGGGINSLIEQRQLYPLTMLRELDSETKEALGNVGIVLIKQLVTTPLGEVAEKSGVEKAKLEKLSSSGWYILHEYR
ncbi:MAG: restriction endonuclease, partial [Candidatus Bathyarchaeia archaeon]